MRFHNSIIKGTQIRLFLRKDVSLGLRKSIDKINIRSKTLVNKEKKRAIYPTSSNLPTKLSYIISS